jgi:hypothetical protein
MQPIKTQWVCQNISAMFYFCLVLQCCHFPRYFFAILNDLYSINSLLLCTPHLRFHQPIILLKFFIHNHCNVSSVLASDCCRNGLQYAPLSPHCLICIFTEHADTMLYVWILLGTHITNFLWISKISEHLTSLSLWRAIGNWQSKKAVGML